MMTYIPSELRAFLIHVTGKITVAKMSIQVSFMEDTQAIAAHTCTGQLVFPRGILGSYEDFALALKAVIFPHSSLSFNMV